MKAIIVKANQIISLENVREVKLNEYGTGAKSNPNYWNILVKYTDGLDVVTDYFYEKGLALNAFSEIFQILTAE